MLLSNNITPCKNVKRDWPLLLRKSRAIGSLNQIHESQDSGWRSELSDSAYYGLDFIMLSNLGTFSED